MNTIEIDKDLFCNMIFSLLDQAKTDKQVAWLESYGREFYELGLYAAIEDKHSVTKSYFDDITEKFWGKETPVEFKECSWSYLQELVGTDFYQKYLSFHFGAEKTVNDIELSLGDFQEDGPNRYYSPSLLKCIVANHNLRNEDQFYFTKAITPELNFTIVFKIKVGEDVFYYDVAEEPK